MKPYSIMLMALMLTACPGGEKPDNAGNGDAASSKTSSEGAKREEIRIVGSSTVFPFVSVAAETFGRDTDFRTPVVEATGTGGGMKLFCSGVGVKHPDFTNASRPIKDSERELCTKNGVNDIREIPIGYDGIVLANTRQGPVYTLTLKQLFLAIAREVPGEGELIKNPYENWKQIDANLPDSPIEVYGPPTTSGTRDAFVEMVMDRVCEEFPVYASVHADKKARKQSCRLMREDGRYIAAGENDNLIVQKLKSNPQALGIFGYSYLDQNSDTVQAASIEGVDPAFASISDGSYPISRNQ